MKLYINSAQRPVGVSNTGRLQDIKRSAVVKAITMTE